MANKKTGIVADSFEQLEEFGRDTARQTVKSLKDTFNPINIIKESFFQPPQSPQSLESSLSSKQKHTPLDFEKLKNKYQDQEKAKTQALKNRLFQLVKGGEEKLLWEEKRKKKEKEQQLVLQEQEKKRREEEQKRVQTQAIPQGKKRRSIFSAKKVAAREQMEVKPSSGKQ